MALLRAVVKWFHPSKGFGVAVTVGDYKEFGIGLYQLRGFSMGPEGHPELLRVNLVPPSRPDQGTPIYLRDTGRTNQNRQPVADMWGFVADCDALIEKSKRVMTPAEATQYLADQPVRILDYTERVSHYVEKRMTEI